MNFARQQVADACRKFGSTVNTALLPDELVAQQVLWAICGNESSFGANCAARHEPAYDRGGIYAMNPAQAALLDRFGGLGACSYGPMQVMLVNCPAGFTPDDFSDVEKGVQAGVFALSTLLRRNRPTSLAQIGSCYNAGHVQETYSSAVLEYIKRLLANYNVLMPWGD
jgi:hypothetical protein